MTRLFFVLALLCVSCGFISCGGPKKGSTTPAGCTISIQNPQYNIGHGTPAAHFPDDADVFVTIMVQMIDQNGNAVVFRRYDFNKTYTSNKENWISQAIEVPTSGDHVIQVELSYSECTSPGTSCTTPVAAGKKKYARQATYRSKQSTYTFSMSNANIVYESCGC